MKISKNFLTTIYIFILVFLVYFISGPSQKTPYDYFVRLSAAFLHGRFYLPQVPSHLNELISLNGKYFVVYPPMPAILMMPFVLLFGTSFSQTLFSQLIGAVNVALVYLLFNKLKFKKTTSILLAFTLGLGTNHWYLASIGSAWYLAHILAVFFTLLALNEFFGKKRLFLTGFFLGAAFWSRLPIVLNSLFFVFLILLENKKLNYKIESILRFLGGLSIFIILNFVYNFLRFKTIWNVGYKLIPGILSEPWYQKGIFHFSYIPRHLRLIFLKMPVLTPSFPFVKPSLEGMALWLTTPVLLFCFFANFKKKIITASLLAILATLIPNILHGTVGFSQFGYRFSMDFILFLLIILSYTYKKSPKFFYFLFFLSISINFWGVLLINKFGWFSW